MSLRKGVRKGGSGAKDQIGLLGCLGEGCLVVEE